MLFIFWLLKLYQKSLPNSLIQRWGSWNHPVVRWNVHHERGRASFVDILRLRVAIFHVEVGYLLHGPDWSLLIILTCVLILAFNVNQNWVLVVFGILFCLFSYYATDSSWLGASGCVKLISEWKHRSRCPSGIDKVFKSCIKYWGLDPINIDLTPYNSCAVTKRRFLNFSIWQADELRCYKPKSLN